jgi:hypothetical protein
MSIEGFVSTAFLLDHPDPKSKYKDENTWRDFGNILWFGQIYE